MPEFEGAYDRSWKQAKQRGKSTMVTCGYCGRKVPRFKAFVVYKGFNITDPSLRRLLDKNTFTGGFRRKIYVCPSCARFHGIRQKGKNKI
ncbi:MAG: hypothetical protein GXN99_02185 [Candidatus Nanohaloarchaeota archaeon]|nr:hypothetical protein [Candidatus Nanohaloarchaeota archaeon]